MPRTYSSVSLTIAALFAIAACSGEAGEAGDAADEDRDLTLPPVPAITAIGDAPESEAEEEPAPAPPPPPPRREPVVEPTPEPEPEIAPPPPAPEPPSLAPGMVIAVAASDTLTSRHNSSGDSVLATLAGPIADVNGDIIIPAGAVFAGIITELAPAETPGGEGRMTLRFDRVRFDGSEFAIEARVDSIGTRMKGRGVTAGDAAKVGVGAVVGGLAGRVLGGNRTGTAVGAAAGAAAGVGIAAATRDIDIILDAGAPVRLVLTAPFMAVKR